MEPWRILVREDVTAETASSHLANCGLVLASTGQVEKKRHLECEAPVSSATVKRVLGQLPDIRVDNMVRAREHVTFFDVTPLGEQSLSNVHYKLLQVLHLSDPKLLRAEHIGSLYSVQFRQGDEVVERCRTRLWELGVHLGPNLSWIELVVPHN